MLKDVQQAVDMQRALNVNLKMLGYPGAEPETS